MKQSVLIASVLGGGVALGGLGVAGYQAVTRPAPAPAPLVVQASAPVAQVAAVAPVVASVPVAAVVAAPSPAPAVAAPAPVKRKVAVVQQARYAKVLGVEPISEQVVTSKQVCRPEQVVKRAPVQDENRVAGTVIGGLIGGVLGNQVGGGNGKKIATVVGTLAGGYAGNQTQDRMQQRDTETVVENRCRMEDVTTDKLVGYKVRYSLDGQVGTVRMDHRPEGSRLPVRHGEVVTD